MSKFSEKVKDFLYDATDYVLIIAIVLVVLIIITWRLDVLFAKNTDANESTPPAVEETIEESPEEEPAEESSSSEEANQDEADSAEEAELVTFEIPEGASSPTVANIVLEAGLIEDTIAFLQKAREMELETEFVPGTYEVESDILNADLIETIAGQ